MGQVQVSETKYWGAQTQRSLNNFKIGNDRMPLAVICALALIKKVAAIVNGELGKLPIKFVSPITQACDQILDGNLYGHFPLSVWQTGSGTQTNMNVNEVIANRATAILGERVHPNDHVNLGQSSNDCFPTAMHIAAVLQIEDLLLPALQKFRIALLQKEQAFSKIIKVGRTHLMDATPLTLGQEFSGYRAQVDYGIERIEHSKLGLRRLAQGGTAVGTGLNTHPEFAARFVTKLNELSGRNFLSAPNKFESLASHDALLFSHGALKTLAASFMKIANDLRWMGSGPNCGLGELRLPENEPGSSIMPGKVNPTQCESMTMICCQIFGNDVAINFGGASGNFELNVFKPMIIFNYLHSVRLLADSANSFVDHCLDGILVNKDTLQRNIEHSLMMVTALVPHLGYDKSAAIASLAASEGLSLKKAALKLGFVTEAEFDDWANPEKMLG